MFFSTRANVRRVQAERVYDHQDLLGRQEERRVWMRYAYRRWHGRLIGQTFTKTMGELILNFVVLVVGCAAIFCIAASMIGLLDKMVNR